MPCFRASDPAAGAILCEPRKTSSKLALGSLDAPSPNCRQRRQGDQALHRIVEPSKWRLHQVIGVSHLQIADQAAGRNNSKLSKALRDRHSLMGYLAPSGRIEKTCCLSVTPCQITLSNASATAINVAQSIWPTPNKTDTASLLAGDQSTLLAQSKRLSGLTYGDGEFCLATAANKEAGRGAHAQAFKCRYTLANRAISCQHGAMSRRNPCPAYHRADQPFNVATVIRCTNWPVGNFDSVLLATALKCFGCRFCLASNLADCGSRMRPRLTALVMPGLRVAGRITRSLPSSTTRRAV